MGSCIATINLTIDWILSQFGESRDDVIGYCKKFVLAGV